MPPKKNIHVPDDERYPSAQFINHKNQYSQDWLGERLEASKEGPVHFAKACLDGSQEQFAYINLVAWDG